MSTAIAEIRQTLTRMSPEFKNALPSQIDPEKFARVAMTAIQMNPSILSADRTSLYSSCMKAAQDGLMVDGREAALVIFGDKVQYMPMIAGILKKVRQSGEVKSIAAHVVREKDKFTYYVDETGEHFRHDPCLDGDPGEVRLVFAYCSTKDGGMYFDRMSKFDIEKVRNAGRAKNAGPWRDWWDEMAKKTVLKRLSKRLPICTDIGIEDDDYQQPQPAPIQEQEKPQEKPSRNSVLQSVVDAEKTIDVTPEPIKTEDGKAF